MNTTSKGRPWARRIALVAALGTLLSMTGAGAAWAKLPGFTVEVTTERPRTGEPVRIIVRFWDDPAHSIPAGWLDDVAELREIPGLIGLYRADRSGLREWGFPITLRRGGPATYGGQFIPREAGLWVLVPFPHLPRESIRGAYPVVVEIYVAEGAGTVRTSTPLAD